MLGGKQWRIQDFPQGVSQLPKVLLFFIFFAENCMKMKEFGPGGASLVPPWICQWEGHIRKLRNEDRGSLGDNL